MRWKHGSKPVIGMVGGIGSGKSTVARQFAREGCAVIDSDALSHAALEDASIKEALRATFGNAVFDSQGRVIRRVLGRQVFTDPSKLQRLEALIHPEVARRREVLMQKYMGESAVRAVVWDTPLLVERGLDRECDALVYVKVPREVRLARLKATRGWDEEELSRREKLQIGLDKKGQITDYCVDNSGDEVAALHQVQQVLSHLLATDGP